MQTLFLSASDPAAPALAAQLIRRGELVAIPTETVYGLGADGLNPEAVAKIFRAKGRPQDNPLILHIWDAQQLELFCHHIPESAYALAKAFWPGPLTMVLPARDIVPKTTTAGLSTVAIRCPDNAVTREIIRLSGVPIAAPSANISGKPSTTTAQHVLHDHDGKIAAIVDGGPCRVGVESTIVDLTEDRPRLLRPGAGAADLRAGRPGGGQGRHRPAGKRRRGEGPGHEVPPLCSPGAGGHRLRQPGGSGCLHPNAFYPRRPCAVL